MKKNYALSLIAYLCLAVSGYGQIITFDFNGLSGNEASAASNFNDANLSGSTITRGTGLNAALNGNRFNATSWATANISNAVSGNNYMEFTITPNASYSFDVTTIDINFQRSGTGVRGLALRSSLDGYTNNIDTEKTVNDVTGVQTFTFIASQTNNVTAVTYRFYGWAEATSGSGGFEGAGDDIVVNGSVNLICTDAVDFANVQFPNTAQTITVGDNLDVFAQCFEPTVTSIPSNQGPGIVAWIGYNSTNDNPSNTGWTWIPATYNNAGSGGVNDEYQANLGTAIAVPGTYYFASRFELNGCGFVYGGTGGVWNNDSVQLTVQPDQVDFCNVDFPKTANTTTGDAHNVYAQAYEPGVTDAAGQGANIEAWIGYNTNGINYEPWQATGWTWVAATYDSDFGNNDQYVAEIGSALPAGTYFYASRFRLNGSDFSYGGIQSDNVGNFWDTTTNNSGTLVVTNPPVADVVITEIMYNPPGADDYEWIEICNLNVTAQDVSNYTVDVNGNTRFTFPSSTSIPANTCITVLLGHLASSPAPDCPFTPDYSNPIGATNFLINGGATITLESPSDDVADSVSYDDADSAATDAGGSSFHVIDATQDNSDTDTNWQAVIDGGSPGDNTLISPCTAPELQLVDAGNTDQACGFTINFGSQATTFDTDVTFDIDNDGSSDLTVTSFAITGTNAGNFSIVSPAIPFTVTAGNTQTVTIRFTPSAIGARNATLTINNNDSDESTCTVDLQGTGTNPVPEINVEGDIGSFPDIADGDTTPSGFDNTLFAAQFIGSSQEKTFRIQNIGTAVLNISNVSVSGTNPGDFTISIAPATSVAASGVTIFEVSFSPLAAGVREADITITNNDADEGTYTFRVRGTGNCVASSATISPQSGPVGTIVTVTGSNLSSATATVNGLAATVNNISNTTMEVTIPVGALSGNIEITDNSGCPRTIPFTVIDTQIGTCEGGSALAELFISEVTDATYGSLTYIEIYNATGANINLANYEIRVYSNGSDGSELPTPSDNPAPSVQVLSGTINAGDTFVVTVGTYGVLGNALCATPGGNGSYGDLVSNSVSGINVVNNEHDFIGLYNSGTLIDAFGEFGVDNWMNSTSVTGDRGFNFRRLNTATPLPTTTFSTSDWNIIDWAGSGSSTCANTNDYSDIGSYDFSTGTPPSIITQPNLTSTSCDITASISVTATEGFTGGNALGYQWYASAPGDTGWTALTDNATYSGTSTATLNILNTISLDNYQYYCQVREDDATCYTASNATRLIVQSTIWYDNAGTLEWSNGTPSLSTVAVIDADYDTTSDGNFSACNLIINATHLLTISNNTFVMVENNLTVNGHVLVAPYGSFVQNSDTGVVNGAVTTDKTRISVEKLTGVLNSNQEYTYWSSPVLGETINDGLAESDIDRRFWFNAQNFRDSTQETNNNNATVAGQDDIDDNANDWTYINAGSVMQPGVGYAATHDLFINPGSYKYIFEGPFNNGIYNIFIYRNDAEMADNNWNFIGNPYPSAIDADLFLAANSSIDQTVGSTSGAIFFWSHNTGASATTNGNENLNYSQSDYAIINMSGQTAGGDGVMPTRHIPSGQGFFISMSNTAPSTNVGGTIERGTVLFNNNMRITGNNNQFFRNNTIDQDNKLWLNLTSDNGVFNQVLIAYLDGATNADDDMYYDAHKNLSSNANSILYSLIDASEKKFAIQGKAATSLTLDEVIPLGFYTSINVPTLYTISIAQLQGAFMNDNAIYVKDTLLGTIHNLTDDGAYTFTSETGEFNSRFEIVFQPESLSVNENDIDPNDLSIVELGDGDVEFSVGKNLVIKHIDIIDVTGRTVYKLKANNATEVYNLSRLSQAAYIARVTLSNGQTITKKAVKLK